MFYYRVTATGQWCGAAHSTAQAAEWVSDYASALGVAAGAIEEVESETDLRTGTLLVEPLPPPLPDPAGLRQAVLTTFGRQASNAVFSKYPTAIISLEQGDWATLRATVDDMLADAVLDATQHQTMLDLMGQYNIPGGV